MAQGIINAVLETAEENNATEVNAVTIEIGRLAMVNPEQLEFILGVLVENTLVEDAEIKIYDPLFELKFESSYSDIYELIDYSYTMIYNYEYDFKL